MVPHYNSHYKYDANNTFNVLQDFLKKEMNGRSRKDERGYIEKLKILKYESQTM